MNTDAIDRLVEQWTRERPDVDVSPTHVLQRITRLYLLQSAAIGAVLGRFGVTFGEYEVLAALRRSGPPYRLNPTQLFSSLVLSSGAMTNRLDRLEQAGLVERLPDPGDRRGRLVGLTDAGRAVVDSALVAHVENERRLLAGLTEEERGQLAGLLRKLLVSEPYRVLDPLLADERTRAARAPGGRARLRWAVAASPGGEDGPDAAVDRAGRTGTPETGPNTPAASGAPGPRPA